MRRARSLILTLTLTTATVIGTGLGWAAPARADVVDDAYAQGSEAAAANDWAGAIEHWQRALELLPGRSAQLDYDLGTAYAQLGELGRATYHLERALQPEARPSVEVAEAARRNRGIVRRQAEVQAEVNDARVSRSPSWWDLVVDVLAGQALAWISLVSAWLLVGASEQCRRFDFWLGRWAVHVADGTVAGHNHIERAHAGCALLEHWASASGGSGTSTNYFDPEKQLWVQNWIDASGSVIQLEGDLVDGAMVLVGRYIQPDGTASKMRGTWTALDDGRVRQFFETSTDGGETWVTWFEGFYSRE
jgi:hypothetical protein